MSSQETETKQGAKMMPISTTLRTIASLIDNYQQITGSYKKVGASGGGGYGGDGGNSAAGMAGGNGSGNGLRYRMGQDLIEAGVVAVSEITKRYPGTLKMMVNFLPEEMRPYAGEVLDMYKDEPWDKTVEFLSRLAKAKGKDVKTGEYRKTLDVAKEIAANMLQEKMVEKFLGGLS